jgi:hypothetical protein
VYQGLAKLYHWTPEQIADMTRYQQMVMLGDVGDEKQVEGTMTFNTLAELDAWRKSKGLK